MYPAGLDNGSQWIATSTALYLVHALVGGNAEPYTMSFLLDTFVSRTFFFFVEMWTSSISDPRHIQDFYVIPVPNPDGYVFTWEHDRFWYVQPTRTDVQCKLSSSEGTRTDRSSGQMRNVWGWT